MADEVALGFLGDIEEPFWLFLRSTERHSGNDSRFDSAFKRFIIEEQERAVGYYGCRLDNLKLVAGKSLIKWSEE